MSSYRVLNGGELIVFSGLRMNLDDLSETASAHFGESQPVKVFISDTSPNGLEIRICSEKCDWVGYRVENKDTVIFDLAAVDIEQISSVASKIFGDDWSVDILAEDPMGHPTLKLVSGEDDAD